MFHPPAGIVAALVTGQLAQPAPVSPPTLTEPLAFFWGILIAVLAIGLVLRIGFPWFRRRLERDPRDPAFDRHRSDLLRRSGSR